MNLTLGDLNSGAVRRRRIPLSESGLFFLHQDAKMLAIKSAPSLGNE